MEGIDTGSYLQASVYTCALYEVQSPEVRSKKDLQNCLSQEPCTLDRCILQMADVCLPQLPAAPFLGYHHHPIG